ncbi:MAG: lactonase family protein [Gemmatimonadota bacterium]|nr:lactonase family protein [Gemmatimonadota bacterium]
MNYHAYITVSSEDRILKYRMDPGTGDLDFEYSIPAEGAPGPLAVDPDRGYLYLSRRGVREISAYSVDSGTGGLTPLGSVSVEADACYLSTDRNGRFLLSASYGGGMAYVHAIRQDGTLSDSPVHTTKTLPKAHFILTDPSNRLAFLPHVGESNTIIGFRFNEDTGALREVSRTSHGPDVGPRHLAFHPELNTVYASNEQGSSVTAYLLDPGSGILESLQTLSTLPEGFNGENTCAQIHIHPSGRYLYVSNRGHDSIACFAVDGTGRLTGIGIQRTEPVPRAFGIDPTGHFLFAGGQDSGRLASYRIDAQTGRLSPLRTYTVGKQSMWVLILALPA